MLDMLKDWLQTFPQWEGTLQLDYTQAVPGHSGLYPGGITELSRREDVQGNLKIRYGGDFTLRRSAATGEENARWLLQLQSWVADQARLGLAPTFGDEPNTERLRAFDGKLEAQTQAGCALYTVRLYAEFTKIYEVK